MWGIVTQTKQKLDVGTSGLEKQSNCPSSMEAISVGKEQARISLKFNEPMNLKIRNIKEVSVLMGFRNVEEAILIIQFVLRKENSVRLMSFK